MATVVLTFRSDDLAGQYLAQLEDAALGGNIEKYMIQGQSHIIVGEDLPDADPVGTWPNDNVFTFKSEDGLASVLSNSVLPNIWTVKNKGAMFTFAGLEGGRLITPEAQAVLDRMTGLTATEVNAIINFVNAESVGVGNGNWAKVDEFFSFGLAGANALVGFIAKTGVNTLATFSIEGAIFNGIDAFIDTNYNPFVDGVNYKQDDAMAAVFVIDADVDDTVTQVPTGVNESLLGQSTIQNASNAVGGVMRTIINSAGVAVANARLRTNLGVGARLSSESLKNYIDGVESGQHTETSNGIPNFNAYAGARSSDGVASQFFNGKVATVLRGAAIGFDQAAHYTNHLQYLIDLGTFATPVLDRYVGLSDIETAAIRKFVNAEVIAKNWGLYDEFFCFALAGANALIGFKSKTAINTLATFSIEGATFNGTTAFIDTAFNPSVDGVNYKQDNAQMEAFVTSMIGESGATYLFGALIANGVFFGTGTGSLATRLNSSFDIGATDLGTLSNALNGLSRVASTEFKRVLNGVEVDTAVVVSAAIESLNVYVGCHNSNGTPTSFMEGTLSTFMVGGSVANQAAHNTNQLEFLIDLGVFATPVLNRYSALTQTETDAITAFVNQEVRDGNWGSYDEFFCFSLNATDRLIGFKSKTGTVGGSGTTFDINGATFDGNGFVDTNFNPLVDGVNYEQINGQGGSFLISETIDATNRFLFGNNQGNGRLGFIPRTGLYRVNAATGPTIGQVSAGSLYMASRINASSTGTSLYKDGALYDNSAVAGSTTMNNENVFVGGTNSGGLLNGFIGTIASFIIGGAVGFDQVKHNTNHRKLLTDLGVTL